MIPVRSQGPPPAVTRVFADLLTNHPLYDALCPGCDGQLGGAGPVALVYVGPGDNPDDQAKARAGRWHTGAAVAVHAACAGADTQGQETGDG